MARYSVKLRSFAFRAPMILTSEKMFGAFEVYGMAISMVVPSEYWFALEKLKPPRPRSETSTTSFPKPELRMHPTVSVRNRSWER